MERSGGGSGYGPEKVDDYLSEEKEGDRRGEGLSQKDHAGGGQHSYLRAAEIDGSMYSR